jgi:phage protein D/phage baseplate assembly protein gpV
VSEQALPSTLSTIPQVILHADGTPLAASATQALSEVRVVQRLSMPASCELVFRLPPGLLEVTALLGPGTALEVGLGDPFKALFDGQVTAVEYVYGPSGEREVRVRGYDRLHRLRKRQTVRTHVQVTLAELARDMVADLGLVVVGEDGPLWRQVIQHQPSDLDLLVHLAEQHGLYFVLFGDELRLLTLEGSGLPLPLTLGGSLLEARLEVNGEAALERVTALGWDPLTAEEQQGQALSARVGRVVGTSVHAAALGGGGERTLLGRATPDAIHAEAAAQAELDRHVAYQVHLWGVADGSPDLRPGRPVLIEGVDAQLAGRYVLTEVRHTVDARRGYVSELSTLPPSPLSCAAPTPAVTLGRVTRVDDPQDLGRVRVSLPAYGDTESEWLQTLIPGAGEDKGLVALPDVGDRVLVLLAGNDPGQSVVLGGLYGMQGPPDSGVEGGAVRRYTLRTPGGQQVVLDDAKRTVRLSDRTGNRVELSPSRLRVHAAVDLEIEAPGKAVTIRGETIDFERA